jgi:multidrug resistance efflux pump
VAGSVSGKQQQKAQAQAQQSAAQAAAAESQQQIADMHAQMTAMQAQQTAAAMPAPPEAPAAAVSPDFLSQLERLAEMKGAGLLSDEEFQAAKTRLLTA